MNKELKENIMQGTLQAFNQKGLKFTMDDIAKILGISKKTIYQVFRDKEALFLETVDYLFDRIKDSEQKIVENQEMDTLQNDSHNPWCDAGMLSGCGFSTVISVKRKISGDLSSGGSTARNRLGNDHCPVGTGHAGRCDPSGPDSDFKDDAGSIVRAVFPARYPAAE